MFSNPTLSVGAMAAVARGLLSQVRRLRPFGIGASRDAAWLDAAHNTAGLELSYDVRMAQTACTPAP